MTILYTPTNDQINDLINNDPQFYQEISDKILDELKKAFQTRIEADLQSEANSALKQHINTEATKRFNIKNTGWATTYELKSSDAIEMSKQFDAAWQVAVQEQLDLAMKYYTDNDGLMLRKLLLKRVETHLIAHYDALIKHEIKLLGGA